MSSVDAATQFRAAIDAVENAARELGVTMADLCESVGISRATPPRWKRSTPATIAALQKLQDEVARRRRAQRAVA